MVGHSKLRNECNDIFQFIFHFSPLNKSFEHAVDIQTESYLVGEVIAGHLGHSESESELIDTDSRADSESCHGALVGEVHLCSASVVVTEGEIESFALRYDVDGEDGVSEEHVIPFDFAALEFSRHGVVARVGELVAEVPSL